MKLKCLCGWKPKPGQVVKCDDSIKGPHYCPDCGVTLMVEEDSLDVLDCAMWHEEQAIAYRKNADNFDAKTSGVAITIKHGMLKEAEMHERFAKAIRSILNN